MGLVFDPTGHESRGEMNLLQSQRGPRRDDRTTRALNGSPCPESQSRNAGAESRSTSCPPQMPPTRGSTLPVALQR